MSTVEKVENDPGQMIKHAINYLDNKNIILDLIGSRSQHQNKRTLENRARDP